MGRRQQLWRRLCDRSTKAELTDNRVFYTVVPDRHAACTRRLSWCGRLRQAPAFSGGKRRAGHNRKLGA
jgi:hypothetical protein